MAKGGGGAWVAKNGKGGCHTPKLVLCFMVAATSDGISSAGMSGLLLLAGRPSCSSIDSVKAVWVDYCCRRVLYVRGLYVRGVSGPTWPCPRAWHSQTHFSQCTYIINPAYLWRSCVPFTVLRALHCRARACVFVYSDLLTHVERLQHVCDRGRDFARFLGLS